MFKDNVYNVVKKIPRGKTLSYKDVAEEAGSPRAWRSVGNILNKNYNPAIPCHRVIKSNGEIGGYNRGSVQKSSLLESERKG
jgi:O-6-methylguanine DNA methyltransferase